MAEKTRILTPRALEALRALTDDDPIAAAKLIETLLCREYTRHHTNDRQSPLGLMRLIEGAITALPMLGWGNKDGNRFTRESVLYDVGRLIDWQIREREAVAD